MAGPADDKPNTTPKGLAPKGPSVRPPPAEPSQPRGVSRPPSKPLGAKALIGQTISERYKIERLLGEGGMGAVYQVEHTLMRKRMAIKVLHPEMTRLPEVVARFEREAMAAAHIDHPHVVTATDFGKLDDGAFFLALEFVEGKSLREVIAMGRLELGRALHIARQIASALSRAHTLKIVHRDLKPENVMLVVREGDPDFVKVLDFGIAKVQIGELTAGDVSKAEPGQPVLTQAGMVYGTPEYMAPEQALGQPVDSRADLYALGVIMYEMLCGMRPFDAESKVALLGMQVTAPVPPMATKAPDANIPPEVEQLVLRLLAKEATERLGDARDLIEGITNLLNQLVGSGRVDATYAPAPRSGLPTNPGLISGIGPAPDLSSGTPMSNPAEASGKAHQVSAFGAGASPLSSAGAGTAKQGRLEQLLGNKAWLIAAGGGLAGILVLVIAIAVVFSGRDPNKQTDEGGATTNTSGDAGSIEPPGESSLDVKVREAIEQINKGNYGTGIEALQNLPDAQGREDVHRALLKAYSQTNRPKEAMREVGLVMKANPDVKMLEPEGISLRTEVRDMALNEGVATADKAAVDEAYNLFARFGTYGFDDLYDIGYGKSGLNYPKAAARAKNEIARADRSKMSPALAVTLDLNAASAAPNCPAIKALLDRAVSAGDERTLALMKGPLAQPRVVGHWRKADLLGCIHEGSLSKASGDLEARLKKPH